MNPVYDQYYASLAASSQQTPVLEHGGSDFGEEEEDVKPSIEYLNSLNEYRKRARSTDDVGLPNTTKAARMDLSVPPQTAPISIQEDTHMEVETLHVGEDPVVYGKQILH